MKRFGLLCIFLILINFSMQIPQFVNCPEDIVQSSKDSCECCKLTCSADGKQLSGTSCGVFQCAEGKQIGYHHGDNAAVFPACCSHPICQD